jgi:hypothetical protein
MVKNKHITYQWLQDPSEINGDNPNNVRHEASRHFMNKKMKYLNDKDLYKGIKEFKRGFQPRNNLVKDENGDLLIDSHNILNGWKSNFSVTACA